MTARELNGPPTMSSDGRRIAWLSSGDAAPRLVLFDVARRRVESSATGAPDRVRAFSWTHLPGTGLALADATGREEWSLHRLRAGEWTVVAQDSGAQLRIAGLGYRRPAEVLIATNARDPHHHDYDVLDLRTGARTRVLRNTGYAACYFDADFRPRLFETVNPDGSRDLWHDRGTRRLFLHIPHEAALVTRFSHFSGTGELVYFVLPEGDTGTRLVAWHCRSGERATEAKTLFSVQRADVVRVLADPASGRPEYLEVQRFRRRMVALSPSLESPLRVLRRRLGAAALILERQPGDRYWLLAQHRTDADASYFGYRPDRDELWPLTQARPGRDPSPIFCRAAEVPTRTGERAVTYLSGLRERDRARPAVLLVHGGPWRRSGLEFDLRRAWLAEQGYVVLEPNFRGSIGFGARWVNAADRQWGAAMQDDLEDTLDWAIRRGHADPARIALVGGSYGGYAVLQLAATSARTFRAVVALSPLTDLVDFVGNLPAPWRTAAPMVRRRIGDPALSDERRRLARYSPVNNAGTLDCPVLLVHGAEDARVPVEMSSRMFLALARAGLDATLALFPDEGHEIVGAANQRARDELIAGFLARHLRGTAALTDPPASSSMRLLHTPNASPARDAQELPC
ncbi:alpha/beta hydrolase family protein [Nocardia sp. NPDC006044]|uniref:alpha/beta hydrolase family protein n=1 Tax=Nocardia sp. NPDC006044 TaxID=3364306 RepID=UPI0036A3CB5D